MIHVFLNWFVLGLHRMDSCVSKLLCFGLAQDEAYTDWFGYSPADVIGCELSAFVVNAADLDR